MTGFQSKKAMANSRSGKMKNRIETLANGDFRVVPLDDPAFIEFTNKRNSKMSTVKIAINRCFGGFGLSNEAFEMLLSRKGIEFDRLESKYSFGSEQSYDYYRKGNQNEENYLSEYDFTANRSDPDLIAVIEELQQKANGWAAEIGIVEIPADVQWHIHEYDGIEHIAENHRTWS